MLHTKEALRTSAASTMWYENQMLGKWAKECFGLSVLLALGTVFNLFDKYLAPSLIYITFSIVLVHLQPDAMIQWQEPVNQQKAQ